MGKKWKTGKVNTNYTTTKIVNNIIDSASDAVEGAIDLLTSEATETLVNNAISALSGSLSSQISALEATITDQQTQITEQQAQIDYLHETLVILTTAP